MVSHGLPRDITIFGLVVRWRPIAAVLMLVTIVAAVSIYSLSGASPRPQSDLVATPCPIASPSSGTPEFIPATAISSPEVCASDAVLGIPIEIDDLVINLTTNKDQAGPITLTVDVQNGIGNPLTGAKVTVTARSLEMDMGAFPHETVETEPGRYVAERVGMGMGGAWRVEVDVQAPDGSSVIVLFRVELEGPM
jgi:YtkA-like